MAESGFVLLPFRFCIDVGVVLRESRGVEVGIAEMAGEVLPEALLVGRGDGGATACAVEDADTGGASDGGGGAYGAGFGDEVVDEAVGGFESGFVVRVLPRRRSGSRIPYRRR